MKRQIFQSDGRSRAFALPLNKRLRALLVGTALGLLAATAFGLALSRSYAEEGFRLGLPTPASKAASTQSRKLPGRPNLPFAGIATRSADEVQAELAAKSPEALVDDVRSLLREEMNADAFVVWEAILARPNVSEATLLQALALF
ncbi:MAG: hypothetical protein IKW13_07835, partial [Thermoguttaceae bacterium]|nr:hypothetical protein [Thermoguttaceae bacterium]